MSDVFKVKKMREGGGSQKSKEHLGTLDSLHQNHVETIRSNGDPSKISETSEQIRTITKKLITIPENSFEFDHVFQRSILEKKLEHLKEQHEKAKTDTFVTQYYLQNGDIMLDYYTQTKKAAPKVAMFVPGSLTTFDKLFQPADTSEAPTKRKIFDEYIHRMGLSNGLGVVDSAETLKKMAEHCSNCNISREELTAEGILVCPKCGSEEYALVVSDSPGFRDPPKERNNYAYKKMNHLNEILNQFQAKESTKIPDEVMNEVICEIKKRRIDNIASLSEQHIREILKKLERNRYYEHATHILSRLNGNPPPTITAEIEEKIRAMFQEIQAPFLLYCPDDRRNFLSYAYIIYKFLELLELDEYKVHFPLLKSRDRLIAHDQIWKKICDYLQWEFIQSV